MTPLQITAQLRGAISLPEHMLALDGLLAYAVAQRSGRPPPRTAGDCEPVEIPIAREPGGRFHLCTVAMFAAEQAELRWVNRRAPIDRYQELGDTKIRRVQITAGPDKSYRLPLETFHTEHDQLLWYAIGDAPAVEDLLGDVGYLGKRRAVGLGRVVEWRVEACEPWGDGFPVVRDGQPLRPLPLDWPGLADPPVAYRTLTYPYWDHTREEPCAVPAMA